MSEGRIEGGTEEADDGPPEGIVPLPLRDAVTRRSFAMIDGIPIIVAKPGDLPITADLVRDALEDW